MLHVLLKVCSQDHAVHSKLLVQGRHLLCVSPAWLFSDVIHLHTFTDVVLPWLLRNLGLVFSD